MLLMAGAAVALAAAMPGKPRDAGASAAPRALPVATAQPDAVREALRLIEARHESTVATWIRLCQIPALSGEEARRADAYAALLKAAGFTPTRDSAGNVEATWAGATPGAPAVIAAHLDTVFAPASADDIRRQGDRLLGPGTLDDVSGLVAILAAASALRDAGWSPRREIRILATVREETGLHGARAYVDARPDLAAFVAVDGILGRVEHGATGIRWTRWTFSGPGGHALLAPAVGSPSLAAGRAIAGLADLAETSDAILNVSELTGGSAPNAIPRTASFTVDARADDPVAMTRLVADVERIAREAAAREGVRVRSEILQDLPAAQLRHHARSPLVAGAQDILRFVGIAPSAASCGSADHNVALLRGIPAMAVGATTGAQAHALDERADITPLIAGTRQIALLMVLMGEAPSLGAAAASAQ